MKNQKVKNATKIEYKGIKFKSKLELFCYKKAEESNLLLRYEPKTFILLEGFKPTRLKIYSPKRQRNSKKYNFTQNVQNFRKITYTPDFIYETNDLLAIIETKGKPNETYPLKKKLFINMLNSLASKLNKEIIFFEPHNQEQVLISLQIIQSYERKSN